MSQTPKVLILGAGFGGTYVAKKLSRLATTGALEVTIVNRTNYFLFTPLLHEVATGALGARSVAEPLREIFAGTGVKIFQGNVDNIDTGAKKVSISWSDYRIDLPYDYLVIATGAETNYYGITGTDKYVYPLKSLSDAAAIRARIIDCFEQSILAPSSVDRKKLLAFTVVGGGATGVETAAELADFISGMINRYFRKCKQSPNEPGHCHIEEASVNLIHAGKEVLEMFKPSLRKAAQKKLSRSGVKLMLEKQVSEVTSSEVKFKDGASLTTGTVIWTAGVKAIIPKFSVAQPNLVAGRLMVDQNFRLHGQERIFALGDVAGYVDASLFQKDSKNTKPVPMLAQAAVAQSEIIAKNIIASINSKGLSDFHYASKGSMVSVGQWFAIGEIKSINFSGWFAWWMWRTVYLFKFASWRKRFRIAIDWTFDLFSERDITKLS